jgi:hypothetical protein
VEDSKLKDAVQTHSGKDWDAVAALIPGRTHKQCCNRWRAVLDPNIDQAIGHTGRWAAEEDDTLKDAVQTHGVKNWVTIAELVPGRTHKQCCDRWHVVLDPNIDRASGRKSWTAFEDRKLQDAVQIHVVKNWDAIAELVPDRTNKRVVTDGILCGVVPSESEAHIACRPTLGGDGVQVE